MAHSKHWIGIGALLLATAGFVALGRWQLTRAELHRATVDGFAEAAALPLLEQPPAAGATDAALHRRIALRGRYEADTQILLDNMTHAGRAGYQVLTPLRLAGGGLVLVNRGWLAAAPERARLPDVGIDVATADSPVEVRGRIGTLPRAALKLEQTAPAGDDGRVVLSFPDYADVESVLGEDVRAFVVLLDPDAPAGFLRDWAPSAERADRNIAYAVQWFGLAALALGLALGMLAVGWRRRRTR